jgi:hypothetical protein
MPAKNPVAGGVQLTTSKNDPRAARGQQCAWVALDELAPAGVAELVRELLRRRPNDVK